MSHQVVYRKYRSQDFSELIGQEHIAKTISNQILSGNIGHAYLFFGPRGCGKTSTARIFAKTVNCEKTQSLNDILIPCGVCESCKNFSTDDMDIIELDAASNRGIDDARILKEKAYSQPISHKYKVIILDEAHMLTREAVNALLKIIEEPPQYMIFIFCTTEFQKLPITITSRCQRFKFSFAQKNDLIKKLKKIAEGEGVKLEERQLEIVADMAKGSFRDAESLLEQAITSGNPEFLDELVKLYKENSHINNFVEALNSDDDEKIWNTLVAVENNQMDLKQFFDIVLENTKNMYEEGSVKFEEYKKILKYVGGIRTITKEDFMYRLLANRENVPSNTKNNLYDNQIDNNYQNSSVSATVSKEQIENIIKRDIQSENRVKSIPMPDLSNKNEQKNRTNIPLQLNQKDLMGIFKSKVGLYNILAKSEVVFENNIVIIKVTSTVSKLFLTKNKVNTDIISAYKGAVNDVKIEVVKSVQNIPIQEQDVKKEDESNTPDDIEKIFGTKFQ